MSTVLRRERFIFHAAGKRLCGEWIRPLDAPVAPVIVFLHEGLGSIEQWGVFPAQVCLQTGLRGLVYERWGHGNSEGLTGPRPDDYLHREARESLPKVLAACGITVPPLLLGHSDGGSIALLFASFYPHQVRGLIVEAAHVFVEEVCLRGIRRAGEAFSQGRLRAGLFRYHREHVNSLFWGWHDVWLRPERRNWNIEAELDQIACPVLIIQGTEDEYGTRAQVDAIAAGVRGPVDIMWLADCGHTPHHQAQAKVLEGVVRFVNQWGYTPLRGEDPK